MKISKSQCEELMQGGFAATTTEEIAKSCENQFDDYVAKKVGSNKTKGVGITRGNYTFWRVERSWSRFFKDLRN